MKIQFTKDYAWRKNERMPKYGGYFALIMDELDCLIVMNSPTFQNSFRSNKNLFYLYSKNEE